MWLRWRGTAVEMLKKELSFARRSVLKTLRRIVIDVQWAVYGIPMSRIKLHRSISESDWAFTPPHYIDPAGCTEPPSAPLLVRLRFSFSSCSGTVLASLCLSRQRVAKGEKSPFPSCTQPVVCFFPHWLQDSRVSFVWHSFVWREGEREREAVVSGGACFSDSMHRDLIRTSPCQKHGGVLIYPTTASDAGCLLNWYVG